MIDVVEFQLKANRRWLARLRTRLTSESSLK